MKTQYTLLATALLFALSPSPLTSAAPAPVTANEAAEIATEAYLYAYPLVLMDVSRRVMSNAGEGAPAKGTAAPVNQFHHMRAFPDASFTDVVRPNADTLYSALWFDVSREPLLISAPDSQGRYYLLPLLDFWTDVFASPGKRTTGTGPQTFALTAPGWKGQLPDGVQELKAPTAQGWLIGRTQTNGKEDYDAVHQFQDGLKAVPLSAWGKPYSPPKGQFDPKVDMSPPVEQVEKMDAATFFARFAEVTRQNPPHANDYPMLQRMARIGLLPGQPFDLAKAPAEVKTALEAAPQAARQKILAAMPRMGTPVNGWRMILNPIGTYGTDYLRRSVIAYSGLGANVVEDAIYPTALAEASGSPFDSSQRYVMHFTREQIPPARAFWSLTMYNDKQFFAENPLNRFAIGNRDKLKFNADGSLDLYIQRDTPGPDKESNWLPAPKSGDFTMNLRLYWPSPAALDGTWSPPPVQKGPGQEQLQPTGKPAGTQERK